MTSNVIPILPRQYEEALAEFRQSYRLDSFLVALSVLGETTFVDSRLQETWNEISDKAVSASPLNDVLDWYALHEVHKSIVNGATSTDQVPTKFQRELFETIFSGHEEASRYYAAKSESPDNPYWRIEVAWELGDVLTQLFGDDDPALYLVQFMRALFPTTPAQPSNHKVIRNGGVRTFIHQTLVPWAFDAEKSRCERQQESDNTHESVVAECRLDQLGELAGELDRLLPAISLSNYAAVKLIELSGLRDMVVILPYLPQHAFERTVMFLVAAYDQPIILDSTGNGFGLFLDILTSLPFGKPFPKGTAWIEAEQIPANSYLESIEHNVYPNGQYPFLPVPFLYQIFDLIDNTRGHILGQVSEHRDLDHGCMTIPVLRDRIHALLRKTTSLRRRHPNPLTGISTKEWNDINFSLAAIAEYLEIDPQYDPLMRLALHAGEQFSHSIFSRITNTDETESRGASIFDDLASTYRAVMMEGWYEVGTACLALFLVTQPLRCAGRLYADWSRLGPMLVESSRLPGAHRVEVAVGFAMDYCKEKNSDTPDVLALKGWAGKRQAKSIIGQPVLNEFGIDRHDIEKDLKKEVGTENWLKIHPQTVIQLVDAEVYWSSVHREVGRGLQDFGPIANALVKPLEGELGYHLGTVFCSPAYQAWKGSFDKNVTLGPMLHLLKKFSTLPEELCALVEATGVSIQAKPKLVQQLFMALKLRNQGSHPVPFSVEDLSELRRLLFEKGLLRQFFDALPPVTNRA